MTPADFLQHLQGLVAQGDWQGVFDWCEEHYQNVKPEMTEAECDAVESGAWHIADMVLEGRRRHAQTEGSAERELVRAA